MWSYYGSKSKIINLYPPPKYGKIIEPFAGSARYALKWFDRDILLVDKYDKIIKLWVWLQQCTKKDILSLPQLDVGENIDDFNISNDEKRLMNFLVQMGTSGSGKTVSNYGKKSMKKQLSNISSNLWKIKHWKFKIDCYTNIDNDAATWYIDPPYQYGGHSYKYSNKDINYLSLSSWCKERKGQVIVCENTKANWMDFKPMKEMQGTIFITTEAIWTNMQTSYNVIQTSLL